MFTLIFLSLIIESFGEVIKNSSTVPIIKVTLEPPAIPYPEIMEIQEASERKRLNNQRLQMEKLEKQFNDALKNGEKRINELITNSLKIFNDKKTLDKVVDVSMALRRKYSKRTDEDNNNKLKMLQRSSEINKDHFEGNMIDSEKIELNKKDVFLTDGPLSFLQSGLLDSVKKKISNLGAPSFNVQLLDYGQPDGKIKSKVKQIDQNFSAKENEIFELAGKYFKEILDVCLSELKKNFQIELNSFTADLDAVRKAVGKKSEIKFMQLPVDFDAEYDHNYEQSPNNNETISEENLLIEKSISFSKINSHQLNIAVGIPEKTYPTVVDFVDELYKKRGATERLLRLKILQMTQQLMDRYLTMIKQQLHVEVVKSITVLASVSSTLQEN